MSRGVIAAAPVFLQPVIQVVGTGIFAIISLFVKRALDRKTSDHSEATTMRDLALENAKKDLEIEALKDLLRDQKEGGD